MDDSIKAINGIVEALVHLRLNLITPCQLKFSYVVRRKGIWGLRHAICDRNNEQTNCEDAYNPEETKYH